MTEVRTEPEFAEVWNGSKVLAIIFDPSAEAAATKADQVAGNGAHRLAVWIRDAQLADAKRDEKSCGDAFTTCFYCLQRHHVTGLSADEAQRTAKIDAAFAAAGLHDS